MSERHKLRKQILQWCPSSLLDAYDAATVEVATNLHEAVMRADGPNALPSEPTMGMWDDFCAVHGVPFDEFIRAYKNMIDGMRRDTTAFATHEGDSHG